MQFPWSQEWQLQDECFSFRAVVTWTSCSWKSLPWENLITWACGGIRDQFSYCLFKSVQSALSQSLVSYKQFPVLDSRAAASCLPSNSTLLGLDLKSRPSLLMEPTVPSSVCVCLLSVHTSLSTWPSPSPAPAISGPFFGHLSPLPGATQSLPLTVKMMRVMLLNSSWMLAWWILIYNRDLNLAAHWNCLGSIINPWCLSPQRSCFNCLTWGLVLGRFKALPGDSMYSRG